MEVFNETILPAYEYAQNNHLKWKQFCFEAASKLENGIMVIADAAFDAIGGFRTMGEWFETTVGAFALMSSRYFVQRCSYFAAQKGVAQGIGILFGASVSSIWWITLIGLSHEIGAQIDGKHAIVKKSEISQILIDSAGGVAIESLIPDVKVQLVVNIILTITQK